MKEQTTAAPSDENPDPPKEMLAFGHWRNAPRNGRFKIATRGEIREAGRQEAIHLKAVLTT